MTALIIEDEATAARRLRKLIKQIDPEIEIIDELDSIESSVQYLRDNGTPDVIFLDIHLADGSSFDIFHFVDIQCPIIFTTAYHEYAIEAFKVNAIDYLLKPIKAEKLATALKKLKRNQSKEHPFNYQKLAESIKDIDPGKRFLLKMGARLIVVTMKEVAYFHTEDKVSMLTTHEGKRYPIDYSLDQLDTMAPTDFFFRINRQFIISLSAIDEMYAYSKSRVKLQLTPHCPLETIVSTERSPHFKRWLEGR